MRASMVFWCLGLTAFGLAGSGEGKKKQEAVEIPAISFSAEPGVKYIAIKPVAFAMGWAMRSEKGKFYVKERAIQIPRTLFDGTRLVPLRSLEHLGLTVDHDSETGETLVSGDGKAIRVVLGEKRIEINKSAQKLRAWQGDYLVAETVVSTGRSGFTTPNGAFDAGPEKSRMRYSRKYDNSPMPYSIQIEGGYFMHGYTSVPRYPASHGCVRLPMWGANAARWLFEWTDLGTPITIANDWVTELPMKVANKPVEAKPAPKKVDAKPEPVVGDEKGASDLTTPVKPPKGSGGG